MDKRVIFAVAGAGKTTYIVNQLSTTKRSLIVTYTNGNFDNLTSKISRKFDGKWPENVSPFRRCPRDRGLRDRLHRLQGPAQWS